MQITGMPLPAMAQLIYTLYLSVAYHNQTVFSPCQVFKCAVLSLRKKTKNTSKNYSGIGLAPTEDQPVLHLISSVYTSAFMHFLSFCCKTTINIDGLSCNIIRS